MKTSFLAAAAAFVVALLLPAVNASPVQAADILSARDIPAGCTAATNAQTAGDTTAMNNAIAACKAASAAAGSASEKSATASGSTQATNGTSSAAGSGSYTPVKWHQGCYDCEDSSQYDAQYYEPGCHCENCLYVTCG